MNSISTDIKSNSTEISVGEILKQARQQHKVRDLNVIAEELCIRPHLLEALELGNFGIFPSSCYAIGFLKNYATYLGLDTRDVILRYEAEYAGSKECVVLAFPEAEKHSRFPVKSVAGIATLCIALIIGVWTGFSSKGDVDENVIAPSLINHEISGALLSNEVKNKIKDVKAVSTDKMKLTATQDVWVRLSDQDGVVQVEKILIKGEGLETKIDEGLSLTTNNAAALSVDAGSTKLEALGGQGELIENIKLERKELLELSMLR